MALIADLHNHSCLSPCGSLELSPGFLVELAASRGVDVLGLTDHNSSLNCPAFAHHCRRLGIIPFFGMEVTTQEEVHVLCLFSQVEPALSFGEYVYSILLPFPNDPEKTGDQVYVDKDDNIEGEVEYYLCNPIDLSIDDISGKAAEYGGITIPAHVDRPAFSLTSQLGVIVKGDWAALECVRIPPYKNMWSPHDGLLDTLGYPLVISSDAHFPEHVGRRCFKLDTTKEELLSKGNGEWADMEIFRKLLEKQDRS